jgi:hypothetical protein
MGLNGGSVATDSGDGEKICSCRLRNVDVEVDVVDGCGWWMVVRMLACKL